MQEMKRRIRALGPTAVGFVSGSLSIAASTAIPFVLRVSEIGGFEKTPIPIQIFGEITADAMLVLGIAFWLLASIYLVLVLISRLYSH